MPSALFKYCHPNRAKDMIVPGKIRFSPVEALNDPFEALPNLDFLKHPNWVNKVEDHVIKKNLSEARRQYALAGRLKQDHEIEKIIKKQVHATMAHYSPGIDSGAWQVIRGQRAALRFLCLSQQPPDHAEALLIWSHYTDGHRGFVVEVEPGHPFMSAFGAGDRGRMREIQYEMLRPSMDVGLDGNVIPDTEAIFTKSEHWRYEKEFRVVTLRGHPDLDHSDCDALAELPPKFVRRIVLGAECTDETRQILVEACGKKNLCHVLLQKAEVDFNRYAIALKAL